jgi:hypothetical protein
MALLDQCEVLYDWTAEVRLPYVFFFVHCDLVHTEVVNDRRITICHCMPVRRLKFWKKMSTVGGLASLREMATFIEGTSPRITSKRRFEWPLLLLLGLRT